MAHFVSKKDFFAWYYGVAHIMLKGIHKNMHHIVSYDDVVQDVAVALNIGWDERVSKKQGVPVKSGLKSLSEAELVRYVYVSLRNRACDSIRKHARRKKLGERQVFDIDQIIGYDIPDMDVHIIDLRRSVK
jgi:hypothetical protein